MSSGAGKEVLKLVSDRAQAMVKDTSSLLNYNRAVQSNQYDEERNPNGIVNMGLAENHLCEHELVQKLQSISTWSSQLNYYPHSHGEFSFRQRLCTFFREKFCSMRTTFDPHRMIISSGVSGAISLLSFVIADVDDVFLIASPYYTLFDFDVAAMARNSLFSCPLLKQDTGEFCFSVEIFKQGYTNAIARHLRPRTIILVNPHNPLGDIYDEITIRSVLEFAAEKQLHVIVDEIYALSVFHHAKPFKSILNYDSLPDPSRTHFLWSFSKDFALSGTRVGVLYVGTVEICNIASKLNFLMVPSSAIQYTLKSIIDDHDWTNAYIKLNQQCLTERYQEVKEQIEQIDSTIQVRDAEAGHFLWVNFRSILHDISFDEEIKLFQTMLEHGVYITNGKTFRCSEPGWFRLVFAVKVQWIDEGIKRMKKALNAYRLSSVLQSHMDRKRDYINNAI